MPATGDLRSGEGFSGGSGDTSSGSGFWAAGRSTISYFFKSKHKYNEQAVKTILGGPTGKAMKSKLSEDEIKRRVGHGPYNFSAPAKENAPEHHICTNVSNAFKNCVYEHGSDDNQCENYRSKFSECKRKLDKSEFLLNAFQSQIRFEN